MSEHSLRITDHELRVDETVTASLIISSAPQGLAGFDIYVAVSDNPVLITGGSYPGSFALTSEPELRKDGRRIRLRAADVDNVIQAGSEEVILGTIRLRGVEAGSTTLVPGVEEITDDEGGHIDAPIEEGRITVNSPPTSKTETERQTSTPATLSPSESYSYRPVSIDDNKYRVVWNLDQFEDATRAVVREPSDPSSDSLTLVSPEEAFDALVADSWIGRPYTRDYNHLLEVAKRNRQAYSVMEDFSRASSVLGEWAAAYAMTSVSPAVGLPIAMEALNDSIIWGYDEISNPYQGALSKIDGLATTDQRMQREVKEVTTTVELPGKVIDLIFKLQGAASQIKDTASMVYAMGSAAASSGAGASSLSAAISAGGSTAAPLVIYFIAGEFFKEGVEVAVDGYEAEAKVAAMGHAFSTLRLPYLRQLQRYQRLGLEGKLTPGMAIHYQVQEAHQSLMGAVANADMYEYANSASDGLFGGLYDILVTADEIANAAEQMRDSFHMASASSLDILQSRWTIAQQRHRSSINMKRLQPSERIRQISEGSFDGGGEL